METVKRARRGESGWREIVARQASSGMSTAEFCRVEGINAGLFRRWRVRLSRASERVAVRDAKVARFIELGAIKPAAASLEVRLELGAGVVLTIARG